MPDQHRHMLLRGTSALPRALGDGIEIRRRHRTTKQANGEEEVTRAGIEAVEEFAQSGGIGERGSELGACFVVRQFCV
jgi:hypothetical protein